MSSATVQLRKNHPLVNNILQDTPPIVPEKCDAFTIMAQDILDSSPFKRFSFITPKTEAEGRQVRQRNRVAMIECFKRSTKQLEDYVKDINRLMAGIIEAAVRQNSGADREQMRLRGQKVGAALSKIKGCKLDEVDVLHAELMAHTDAEIHANLLEALDDMCRDVIARFREQLDVLKMQNFVGEIIWFGPDVCKYHYFEHRRATKSTQHTKVSEETENNVGAWTTFEVTSQRIRWEKYDVKTRIEHHLYNAARFQFPAKQVSRPKHLAPLFAAIPEWIAPHTFVVEGDMLRETFEDSAETVDVRYFENELSRQVIATGVNYSPAVTIGSYVLGGWSKADL